jgi:outer membrane protein assembly factor BamB
MRSMSLIIILLSLWACNEPIVPPYVDPTPSGFQPEIIWRRQHGPTKYDQLAFRIELYQDKLLAGYQSETGSGYWIYDKNTGSLIKDIQNMNSFVLPIHSKILGSIHYSLNGKFFRTIDLETFETTIFDLREGGTYFNNALVIIDDHVYGGYDGYNPPNKFGFYRNNILKPKEAWSLFFEDSWEYIETARSCHTSTIGGFNNQKGEAIMYFIANYLWNKNIQTASRIRFQAYNITRNTNEWVVEIPTANEGSEGTGNQLSPVLFKDKIIMPTSDRLRAFHKETGNLLWELNLEQITTTDYAVIDNHFFIATNFGVLHKIDLNTGQIVSKLDLKTGNTGVWQEHKGILYFTMVGNKLFAIDAAKMEVKWEWNSPNRQICSYCSFGNNSPVVDKETDRLYITDGRDMFCIKLPE